MCYVSIHTVLAKPRLASGLCSPWSHDETSGLPRLSDSHFMKFYYRTGPSQASLVSLSTQQARAGKSFCRRAEEALQTRTLLQRSGTAKGGHLPLETNLGDESLGLSMAEPVGNCA